MLYLSLMHKYGIAIHGGAGNISKKRINSEKEKKYKEILEIALSQGINILKQGGKAIDAISEAIIILEDSSLYNAGKGAVFTSDEENEHDASIMDGSNLKAGSVGCSKYIKNPILLSKTILYKSSHVMLVGKGAYDFAKLNNLEIMPKSYFYDEYRYQQLLKVQRLGKTILDNDDYDDDDDDSKYGTVGAVALDINGNLAAGTSTGGIVNKKHGRVGDSAIIGCGTYANNETCAISCTGKGESFIINTVAHEISCKIKYQNKTLKDAADDLIYKILDTRESRGGLIGINNKCKIVMPFNTRGMYRGFMNSNNESFISIF